MCVTRNCLCGITPEVKLLMLLLGFNYSHKQTTFYRHITEDRVLHLYYFRDADKIYVDDIYEGRRQTIKRFGTMEATNIRYYLIKLLEK